MAAPPRPWHPLCAVSAIPRLGFPAHQAHKFRMVGAGQKEFRSVTCASAIDSSLGRPLAGGKKESTRTHLGFRSLGSYRCRMTQKSAQPGTRRTLCCDGARTQNRVGLEHVMRADQAATGMRLALRGPRGSLSGDCRTCTPSSPCACARVASFQVFPLAHRQEGNVHAGPRSDVAACGVLLYL